MNYNKVSNQQVLDIRRIDRYEDKTLNTFNTSSSSKRKGIMESHNNKSLKQKKSSNKVESDSRNLDDPRSPHHVQRNVQCVIQTWGSVAPVCPEHFLRQLLSSRGYCYDYINALDHRVNP